MRIPRGTIDKEVYFVAVDATDLKTRETGLTSFTVVASRNGSGDVTFTTPTITEIDAVTMPGVYSLLVDEQTSIDAGDDNQELCLHITHAGMAPVTRVVELYRLKGTEGDNYIFADTKRLGGTIQTGNDVGAALPSTAPATNGGLPTVDANNRITGIQGTKNDFDDLNDVTVDEVWAKAMSDLASMPGATATVLQGLNILYMALRNKQTTTSSQTTIGNDAGTAIATATISDDSTTFTKNEYA